jgi:hypothetical protein
MVKAGLFALAERSIVASYMMNAGAIMCDLLRFLPSRFRDRTLGYRYVSDKIGTMPGNAAVNDLPLAFFKSVILDGDYSYVIEIGAYSLDRSMALKRTFPDIHIYGLDVTAEFVYPRRVHEVEVGSNTPNTIRSIAALRGGRGLVCSAGTAAYYPPSQIAGLFALTKSINADLALVEPNTVGESSITRSLRRTRVSWYHPYLHLLRQAGYTLPFNGGRQVGCAISASAETMTYLFAQCGSPHDLPHGEPGARYAVEE